MVLHPHRPGASVALAGICVAIDGRDILADVDLDIAPGTLTVITGPNGAGKSTLLETIAGTRAPSSGSRWVSGVMAFVPQRAAVPERLPVSVGDVVSVGAWGRLGVWRRMDSLARDLVAESLERMGITALADLPFSSLSGGQQQRTLLAQGLAAAADLLLLDEPTTGLDAQSALRIRSVLLDEAAHGAAVVCVSHDPSLIDDGHRVVALDGGRILFP